MRPDIERLACSGFVVGREARVERGLHGHDARIKESPDGIGIRITRVENSKQETSGRNCGNQTDREMAP